MLWPRNLVTTEAPLVLVSGPKTGLDMVEAVPTVSLEKLTAPVLILSARLLTVT